MGFGRKTIDRRAFFENLAKSAASISLANPLASGLAGFSLAPFGQKALAQTASGKKKKYVFIYLDGGVRESELFNPQRPTMRMFSDGRQLFNDLIPKAWIDDGNEMHGFNDFERTWGLAPDSDVMMRVDTRDVYAPPIITAGNMEFGIGAGALKPFADKITLVRGVTTSIDHGPAAQMTWTGEPFDAAFPRATLDCLVAAGLGGDALLPHIIWPRSGYVPLSIPQTATQVLFSYQTTGTAYRNYLADSLLSPLGKLDPAYVGDQAAAKLAQFWRDGSDKMLKDVQNPANKAYLAELGRLRDARDKLYQSNFLDELAKGVDNFATTARTTVNKIAARGSPSWIDTLIPTLGLVSYAMNSDLADVATINVSGSAFDAHGGYFSGRHPHAYRITMFAIAEFLKTVDLARTTVVIFSEMGRTPIKNDRDGTDHSPTTTWAIIGGRLGQGKVFGRSDAFFDADPVSPDSGQPVGEGGMVVHPKDIMAAILEDVGYEPGRPIETILGIKYAPPFLRKLLG